MDKIFCTYCGKYHHPVNMVELKPSSALCVSCDNEQKAKRKIVLSKRVRHDNIDNAKYLAIVEKLRYKGAKRIKGYKFEGVIPEPKDESYYKFVSE